MGDFNIDLLTYGHHTLTDDFINFMFSSPLMPSILHPTRITDTSSTLIDNIFLSNVTDCNILSGNLKSMVSDHPGLATLKDNEPEYKTTLDFAHDYRSTSLMRPVFCQNIQKSRHLILVMKVLM